MIDILVFDTNTLISAAILPNSISGRALLKALNGDFITLLTEKTLRELEIVLFRKKFDKYFTDAERSAFLESFINSSLKIIPNITITACRDPKDNKFLELAVSAKASCIITGDEDLLVLHPFRSIPILNPADFLKVY